MKLTHLVKGLKLSKEAREELDRVLAVPEVETILGREEEKIIAQRRELLARLKKIDSQHAAGIATAEKRAVAAARRLEAAEQELRAAKTEHSTAMMQLRGAERVPAVEAGEILHELRDGRDRRIDDLYLIIDRLAEAVRHLVVVEPTFKRNALTGAREVTYVDNITEVKTAQAALAGAKAKLEEIAIAAVPYREVTEQMADLCAGLEEPLAALDLAGPTLDEHGEVKVMHNLHMPATKPVRDRLEVSE